MTNFGRDRDANSNALAQHAATTPIGVNDLITIYQNGKPRKARAQDLASVAGTGNGNATTLQGEPLAATDPTDGQVMTYVEGDDSWEPKLPGTPKHALIAGGAAGDRNVALIKLGDRLDEVIYFVGAGVAVTDVSDLTAEFSITADGKINNAAGTASTGGKLLVRWTKLTA